MSSLATGLAKTLRESRDGVKSFVARLRNATPAGDGFVALRAPRNGSMFIEHEPRLPLT
jgi:hypothetical protein